LVVLQRVTGRPCCSFVRDTIFRDAGLSDYSSFCGGGIQAEIHMTAAGTVEKYGLLCSTRDAHSCYTHGFAQRFGRRWFGSVPWTWLQWAGCCSIRRVNQYRWDGRGDRNELRQQ
jgi:hypothetical protein